MEEIIKSAYRFRPAQRTLSHAGPHTRVWITYLEVTDFLFSIMKHHVGILWHIERYRITSLTAIMRLPAVLRAVIFKRADIV